MSLRSRVAGLSLALFQCVAFGASLSNAPAASTPTVRHGTLFRIEGDGHIAYLYGTVHVGTASSFPLSGDVAQALGQSDKLALELDVRAEPAFQHAMAHFGTYGEGDSIARHIPAELLTQVSDALHAAGIALPSVARLKPWMMANLLQGLELERNGFHREQGGEFALLAAAQEHQLPLAELESADYQLSTFDSLSAGDAERYLRETLADLRDGAALRRSMATMEAWRAADPHAQDAVMSALASSDSIESTFTRRTLLGKRNPEMANSITRIMGTTPVTFVGVGMLHLLGANGLPALFAQRGYQVTRIY